MARAKKHNAEQLRRALKERDEALKERDEAPAFRSATDEILAAISRSPSDATPVFDAIVRSVPRLFGTRYVAVFLVKGDELHLAVAKADAHFDKRRAAVLRRFRDSFPQRIDWRGFTGKALRTGKVSQITPIIGNAKATPQAVELAKEFGYNAMLVAPLMRDGKAIGAIGTTRPEAKLFDTRELALFKAFAAQAVIAIENARLFNETKEALEQQTTSADILKVISGSPTSVQPVFETIARNAVRLCDAIFCNVLRFDGELLHVAAHHGFDPAFLDRLHSMYPMKPDVSQISGRVIRERAVVHIHDATTDALYDRDYAAAGGWRRMLGVPMLREGRPLGVVVVAWKDVGATPEPQVRLLQTFADQAAIAIDNVRLFNETKEALDQQTATSDILRVISSSPGDIAPVLDTILENGLRLCEARHGSVFTFDGEAFHVARSSGQLRPDFLDRLRSAAIKPGRETPLRRVGLELRPVHCIDLLNDPSYSPPPEYAQEGFGTALAVPVLKEGKLIGALAFHRREVRPFSDRQIALLQTFADQAVIAIENARLFNETQEALEQQTATAEILRVISGTPTDTQPVFDTIVRSAQRLMLGRSAALILRRGSEFFVAAYSAPGLQETPAGVRTVPLDREKNFPSRVILDGEVIHIPDWDADEVPEHERVVAKAFGFGSGVQVPLLREGQGIGALVVARQAKGRFHEKEIALLRSFADQAVIAIENVRLFNETKEALEQQTASADVLRVIGSSPADLQPVFDAILENAMRLCDASLATVGLYDGKYYRHVAQRGGSPDYVKFLFDGPFEPHPQYTIGSMIAERQPFHIADYRDLPSYKEGNPRSVATVEIGGTRTYLAVPMLKDGQVVGGITVRRTEVRPFTQKQIELVKTFADQAVIAIENARLFNETKEALERQTATADVLKVISGSPTNVQPVLDSIAERATLLCHAKAGFVTRFDGKLLHLAAFHGAAAASVDAIRAMYPIDPASGGSIGARVVHSGVPVQVPDALADPAYAYKAAAQAAGYRSVLGVPLVREGQIAGVIVVVRGEAGLFPQKQVQVLQTFADQAVIAIENVRLFNETKEALEQQTAISEVLRVISDSPTNVKPVLDAVAVRAAKICQASDARIWLVEGDSVRHAAGFGDVPMPVGLGETLPLEPTWVSGRAILQRAPLHIEDSASLSPEDYPLTLELQERSGFRTILSVPLMRESRALGAIMLRRLEVRPFTEKQVALLKTFADQAAIAIENVRLFNETKEALERQTASGEILASISGSMTDTKPVFDTIVRNLLRLFGTSYAVVALRRGSVFELAGFKGEPGFERLEQLYPLPVDEHTIVGEVVAARQVRSYTPVLGNPAVPRRTADFARQFGFNSMMAAPMMWKGEAIGGIVTARRQPLPFDDKQVALIQSFADQAVIAIENVRLFKELQARTEALTRSVSQLTALGEVGRAISSTLELDEVLRTIVQRAVQLAGLDGGSIYEFDERDERFHLRAAEHVEEEILEVSRKSPIRLGEGAVGRAGATREPVVVEDVLDERYRSRVRELLIKSGSRALLAVPLLREDHLLGALVVSRKSPGQFAPEVIELLKTFATQSAVAIQNARLFREIAEKSSQLEEASRHKSHFLASMSHELRTPLNAILGFNEMILGQVYGEVPSDMKEPLEDIQKSGKHLLRLINNVLDLAKIEAGRMELALADYSVPDTVESVRSTLRPLAEAKGLELVASVPEDIPLAYGDSGRLTQCLMNLAGNSLKFTKAGRVEISVEAKNGRLTWRVSDTGIGIPPDKIETLFSEFRQTDATIASEYGGTGLGLSITKKFVEMHGGRIWVESELGKGSAFTLEIPLRVTAPA